MGETTPPDTTEELELHRAVSDDGTQIVGHVYGHGPPLVLVHAGLGDGVLDWDAAMPFLSDRFACYLMSTRGRGSSGNHPNQSPEQYVEDVVAFVESLGEPVGLAGASGGTMFALGAAAQSKAVAAVAACDPLAFELLTEEDEARLHDRTHAIRNDDDTDIAVVRERKSPDVSRCRNSGPCSTPR
ncbi:alpha/beta fold hydrolase [Natrononativus amylolyticus]|uniref:alpha/beta fold hydrolase n=1 Tax=Natrononativus amylolyticus TaxID=2963434 RepID=UPI003CE501EE